MPDFQTEAEFLVFDAPAQATATTYRLTSVDGATSLLITGAGFTYSGGVPTGGTITSVAHVVTATDQPVFTVTNINVGLAAVGVLLNAIQGVRSQITWLDQVQGDLVSASSTQIRIANLDGTFTDFIGTGFPVPPQGSLTGTVTSVHLVASDGSTVLDDLSINETLGVVAGALFDDVASDQVFLLLNTGANTVTGGGPITVGDVNYYGPMFDGPGNDAISGGGPTGTSYVEFEHNASGATVNLATGIATIGAETNTLTGILGVGGTEFGDTIIGDDGVNQLSGWGGDDIIQGGGGNDFLHGAAGDDTLDGGDGAGDTARYDQDDEEVLTGVTVSLAIAGAQNTVGAGADTLLNIENLVGSRFDDTLTGNAGANLLGGFDGADTLDGGAGADGMFGGDGDDTIVWDAGDVLANVQGGVGTDTLVFLGGAAPTTFDLGAHGFERAEGRLTDAGGEPWATQTLVYDALWRLDTETTVFDDSAHAFHDYDQTSQFGWSDEWTRYDALDRVDVIVTTFDDGTYSNNNYDEADGFVWSSEWTHYDALDRVDTVFTTFDDATYSINEFDVAGTQAWSTQWTHYDGLDRVDTVFTTFDDGSYSINEFDVAGAQTWVTQWTLYDDQDRVDTVVTTYDDGSYAINDYDQANAFSWASQFWLYNSSDQVIAYQLIPDGGG